MTTNELDRTLASDKETDLITRCGTVLHIRPVTFADGPALAEMFKEVDPEDLRFRFLSGQRDVRPDQIAELIEVDHRRTEHLLAFEADSGRLAASAVLAADETLETAEVAIAIAKSFKGQGIGWSLLKHVAELARSRGIRHLCSIESRQNHAALEVERAQGFAVREYEGDPTLVLVEACLD